MIKATSILKELYPHLHAYGCLAHTLHLLCGDITKRSGIANLINEIKEIIKLFHGHILSAKLKKLKTELQVEASLTLPVATRWGSIVICLKNILKLQLVLQRCCIEPDFQDKSFTRNKLLSECFWANVHDLHELLEPITKWINIFESDKSNIYLTKRAFSEIEKDLTKNVDNLIILSDDDKLYIKHKIKERKCYALKSIHKAADLLYPASQGTYLQENEKVEAIELIINVGTGIGLNENEILMDLANYRCKEGFYSTSYLWKTVHEDQFSPILWWKGFCSDRILSKVAVRILSMPPTSAATERSFSTQGSIHTKKRNKLTNERVMKLTFIKHNQKLFDSDLTGKQKKCAVNSNDICESDIEISDQDFMEQDIDTEINYEMTDDPQKDIDENLNNMTNVDCSNNDCGESCSVLDYDEKENEEPVKV